MKIAAMPDDVASPASALSRSAMRFSKMSFVGLLMRPYAKPSIL